MIDEKQLASIASLRRITLKNAEKEYFQELFLYSIYSIVKKDLVFKGGTCLYKIHKLNRFSEDLDFDVVKNLDVEQLARKALYGISLLGINSSIKYVDAYQNAINIGINFHGPLYDGSKESLCFLQLNASLRSKPLLPPKLETIRAIYREFPDFDVLAMAPEEILAEKIDAIHKRDKPRDVYDAWFLLKKIAVKFSISLVNKKLKKQFDPSEFKRKLFEKEKFWERELGKLVIGSLPSFQQVKNDILELI